MAVAAPLPAEFETDAQGAEGAFDLATQNEQLRRVAVDIRASFEEKMEALGRLSDAVAEKFDPEPLLELLADLVRDFLSYRAMAILVSEGSDSSRLGTLEVGPFRVPIRRALTKGDEATLVSLVGDGIVDWAIGKKTPVALPPMETTADSDPTATHIIAPLVAQDETIGLMVIFSTKSPESFSQHDLDLLNILASQSAIALKNTFLYRDLESQNEELSRLKGNLNNIFDSMTTALLVTDPSGRLTSGNRAAEILLGHSYSLVHGKRYGDVFDTETGRAVEALVERVFREGTPQHLEFDWDRFGRSLPVRASATPYRGAAAGPEGVLMMLVDLSESREIERLREIDRLKNELVANVSHELRTPLTSIKAYAETLADMCGEDEFTDNRREFLGVIVNESERLTRLISDLLDLSRLESGTVNLKKSWIHLGELANEVVTLLRQLALQKDISVELLPLPDDCEVNGGREEIERVLINLVSNGIKYNRAGGSVQVRIENRGAEMEISVRDTGIGIPEEALAHIFDKFYRVDSSFTYEVSGTGLGLAIVKRLIELHHGRMEVNSRLGEGSVFRFFLPRQS